MHTVSVHIVTYNSSAYIEECLASVMNQSHPASEIIIVDNASTDHTLERIYAFEQEHSHVSLILNNDNVGFAVAHNQAIQQSKAEYMLILNPDVILHPDYIHCLLQSMRTSDQIGSVSGKLLLQEKHDQIDTTGLVIKKNRQAKDRGANEIDQAQWDLETDVFGVSAAAALYSRTMIEDISYQGEFFDNLFFAYKEDVDVAWRARLFGWEARFEPAAVAYHYRGWGVQKKRSDIPIKIRSHSYINRYYLMLKNDNFLYIVLHLPFIIAFEMLSLSYIIVKERKLLEAWRNMYKHRSILREQRRWIQQHKTSSFRQIYRYFK